MAIAVDRRPFSPISAGQVRAWRRVGIALGCVSAMIALVVLAGWIFDIRGMRSFGHRNVDMVANTAVALLLGSGALLLPMLAPRLRYARLAARLLNVGLAAIALATLFEWITAVRLGIDQLLFTATPESLGAPYLGRPAPNAVVAMLLISAGLELSLSGRRARLRQVLLLCAFAVALVAFLGYASQVKTLYGGAARTQMALPAALALLALPLAIVIAQPADGLMARVTRRSPGAGMLRRLLPLVIGIPAVLTLVLFASTHAHIVGTHVGVWLAVSVMIALFCSVTVLYAHTLDAAELERRRQADIAIATEQRFRAAVETMSDHLTIMSAVRDRDGAIVDFRYDYVNEAVASMLGEPPERLIGRSMRELTPSIPGELFDGICTVVETGQALARENLLFDDNPEPRLRIALDVRVAKFGDGIVAVARDVTDRRLAEEEVRRLNAGLEQRVAGRTEELERANRELESFAYSVSHDLRAPLRSIDGFTGVLLNDHGAELDAAGRHALERIHANATRMSNLIDGILMLSRVSRRQPVRAPIDMSALAGEIVEELRAEYPRPVVVEIEPDLHDEADPDLVRVVLQNLLSNAYKFTSKTAHARIRFGTDGNSPVPAYVVADNGAGFNMQYVDALFVPFQRLHGESEFPGHGIGLATVMRVINKHGGVIRAHGEVGKGAAFEFSLRPAVSQQPPRGTGTNSGQGRPQTVG